MTPPLTVQYSFSAVKKLMVYSYLDTFTTLIVRYEMKEVERCWALICGRTHIHGKTYESPSIFH